MGKRTVALSLFAITYLTAHTTWAAETCGDGLDNDADSLADEGCFPGGGVTADPLSEGLTGTIAPKMGTVVYPLAPDFDPHVAYGIPITFQRTFMSHYRPGTGAGYPVLRASVVTV